MSQIPKHSSVAAINPTPLMPYRRPRTMVPGRQAIALISVHSDPAASFSSDDTLGQDVYVLQVGEALAKLGWQVDIFTRKTSPDQPKVVHHSLHCRTIRLTAGPEAIIHRDELFPYLPAFVDAFQAFQAKAGLPYPLVHTNYWLSGWVGLQLQQFNNVRLLHTHHSLGVVKYQHRLHLPDIAPTRLAVEQQLTEQADCVIATSPQDLENLRNLVSPVGNVVVIPGGANVETFHTIPQAEARSQLGFSCRDQIVLYVGRFDPRKGLETMIRACDQSHAKRSGNLRIVIAGGTDPLQGEASEQRRIKCLVNELGLASCTLFTGRVSHDLLPLYYTAADVCVIPSEYEPFGLVAIEAMACGTPVIASAVGGLKFAVVPEETGLLVPPGNIAAFAAAIDRVLSADELWLHRIRKLASERVQQNFSWTHVAAKLSHLYRHTLAQSLLHDGMLNVAAM
ncbi:MAG: glycosyltransferase [Cyanobacteriota bacterium SKYGB_h_bin112]|nr:glycosyltransferase [Cyanobacteriota bacterium SKYGB_h_bin112]